MEVCSNVRYNENSPAVKRLMREALELKAASDEYFAQPLDDDLFEWHFTIKGPSDSDFEHGFYHGRIVLPPDYPMSPPSIMMLTPNGRFEVNKKICLSVSGYHPETWQPSWSIRTLLVALIAFMPTPANGTIGSVDYSPEERKLLANRSRNWECTTCGKVAEHFMQLTGGALPSETLSEQTECQENTSLDVAPREEPAIPVSVPVPVPVPMPMPVPVSRNSGALLVIKWLLISLIICLLYRRLFLF